MKFECLLHYEIRRS